MDSTMATSQPGTGMLLHAVLRHVGCVGLLRHVRAFHKRAGSLMHCWLLATSETQ